MRTIKHILSLMTAILMVAAPSTAFAQAPTGVRGEVANYDAGILTVKTKSGEMVRARLSSPPAVAAIVPAALADVKTGAYVGVAVKPQDDGGFEAMEVHIFPEAARGTGEGTRPYDLAPGSIMTNGNVAVVVDAVAGPTLTVSFAAGKQQIHVAPATPIVAIVSGDAGDLKVGADVIVRGLTLGDDGVYSARRVLVGRDGLKLPM